MIQFSLRAAFVLLAVASLGMTAILPLAQADEASKDTAVYRLRQRFAAASRPDFADLHEGENWICEQRSAVPGSSTVMKTGRNRFVFQGNELRLFNDQQTAPYYFIEHSMVGRRYYEGELYQYEYVRVEKSGKLIMEITMPTCFTYECLFRFAQDGGIENSWAPVMAYQSCALER